MSRAMLDGFVSENLFAKKEVLMLRNSKSIHENTLTHRPPRSDEAFILSMQDHPGGDVRWIIDKNTFDTPSKMLNFEKLAKIISDVKTEPVLFCEMIRGVAHLRWEGEKKTCDDLVFLLQMPLSDVIGYTDRYLLHPLSNLLVSLLVEKKLFGFDRHAFGVDSYDGRKKRSTSLNAYCAALKEVLSNFWKQTSRSKGSVLSRNFVRGAKKNHASLMALLDQLLLVRSRLLAVRVDCLYRTGFGVEAMGESKVYHQVSLDRDALFKAVRCHYGKGLMGYAWKLEYGVNRGYHYHMLFFFDGSMHQSDIKIGMHIGKMWEEVTKQEGNFYNCNANKHTYDVCGIGTLNHGDPSVRERFERVVGYLTKADYHCRLRLPGKQRSFQTSFCKEHKVKQGRPRGKKASAKHLSP